MTPKTGFAEYDGNDLPVTWADTFLMHGNLSVHAPVQEGATLLFPGLNTKD
jgi:hypothetical protein